MEPCLRLRGFRLERGSNSGPLDQQASADPTELPGLQHNVEDKNYFSGVVGGGINLAANFMVYLCFVTIC